MRALISGAAYLTERQGTDVHTRYCLRKGTRNSFVGATPVMLAMAVVTWVNMIYLLHCRVQVHRTNK